MVCCLLCACVVNGRKQQQMEQAVCNVTRLAKLLHVKLPLHTPTHTLNLGCCCWPAASAAPAPAAMLYAAAPAWCAPACCILFFQRRVAARCI